MRILIAAGGTGGHLLPGVALAKALRARGHHVHFAVKTDGTSQASLAKEGFPSSAFSFAGFPRRLSLKALSYPFLAASAWANARRILHREAPDLVVGMGGYVSVPLGLAAAFSGVTLLLHEQNSRAGLANRLLSRWAAAVGITFQKTEGLSARCRQVWTGLPLRPDLIPSDPAAARQSLGLSGQDMTVLVFGGSQGARALNHLMTQTLPALEALKNRWQFIHLTGESEFAAVKTFYKTQGWRAFVRSYWSDMATLYSAADFVVARAGANTVMELERMGKTALLVPYPHAADDHQAHNARHLEVRGWARVSAETDLTPQRFQSFLEGLPSPEELRRENMTRLAAVPAQLLAASERLAELVEQTGGRGA